MSPKANRIAPNVKTVRSKGRLYYYYIMPNGKKEPLGSDVVQAREAANALNSALRDSGCLVEKILNKSSLPQYDPRNPPMMQVIDEYKNNQLRDDLEQSRITDETFAAKCYILDEYDKLLGKTQCQEVGTFELAQYLKERTGHVQQKHVPLLKKLFRYAIAEGYRDTNPANELQPKTSEKRQRHRHTYEGLCTVRQASPEWLQRIIDIALYSLQRRSDLVLMHRDHVSRQQRTIDILQQKTRNYTKPVYIQVTMGETLWNAVDSALISDIPCPFLAHYRPKRITHKARAAKPHPFCILPDFLSKQFKKYRDLSGAYDHLPRKQRPTLHDIRALGILMYFKAGYTIEYIMALAGHAKAETTEIYIDGHEQAKPVAVNADLSLDQVDFNSIDWNDKLLPPELVKLINEPE